MGRYDNENWSEQPQMNRQRDLVLSMNEFCFLRSKTNGTIKTYTGPITMTISAQESLVVFNTKTKKFEETQDFEKAKQLFVSAPEGWYVVLKNPAVDNSHPEAAKAVNSPELEVGRKINIVGPVSFSLFPGQMTRVSRGHRLRSNQYLLARVYDAEAAKKEISSATIINAKGEEVSAKTEEYFVGQMIVIKGTEVSFYIPPTGIEVIPNDKITAAEDPYVRDAVTLERLEYAILKDEDGEKRYIHGPAVVFPKPTETFVAAPKGGLIFRALELSPISGIYVKVIAAYDETKNNKTIHHPIGEELFITGKDQMIYYPRPEHAMIQYDGKYMHHAIAIPEGEGRYILNRLTGEIKTIRGPQMYLPDPRKEVVVKRKLTSKECELMYPSNIEVVAYNAGLTEQAVEKLSKKGISDSTAVVNTAYSTSNQAATLAIFEANANISRGVSYTKPRTITLDTKYEGVVTIDVWGGYAINVVSKTGKRDVVIGPTTRLLDYDETVEAVNLSCGKPKTKNNKITTAFLQIENNRVSDIIYAQTADFTNVQIELNYCVDFLTLYKDNWFAINDYVKYLCDNMRSLVKREVRKYEIKDFYTNSTEILRNIVLDVNKESKEEPVGRLFRANGMLVTDVNIVEIRVTDAVAKMINSNTLDLIQKKIDLSDAEEKTRTIEALEENLRKQEQMKNETALYKLALEKKAKEEQMAYEEAIKERERANQSAAVQARNDLQNLLTEIANAEIERENQKREAEVAHAKELAEIEKSKQEAYAATVKEIMSAISPDLIAAISANSKAELLREGMASMSPYAIANGESVADTVNKLMRGTPLEDVLDKASTKINF